MNDASQTVRSHQPIRLLRNKIYPTYQLTAIAGKHKQAAQTVLALTIQETFSWLRKRFRDLTIPPELIWTESADDPSAVLSSLTSFQIDAGYKVEVIWLPDAQIWSMQLTEPDLGPDPGAARQSRDPVAGRLFETNIAYKIRSGQVLCGFRTLVSDPEHLTDPCEVFRLAVIGQLVRHPQIGLKHGWQLSYEAHNLARQAQLFHLRDWLGDTDRMLPAVIVAASLPQKQKPASWPSLDVIKAELGRAPVLSGLPLPPPQEDVNSHVSAVEWPIDFVPLARSKMGYAHFFTVPVAQLANFSRITQRTLQAGDILIVEPAVFGGDTLQIDQQVSKPDRIAAQLDQLIQNYPMNKPFCFNHIDFLPEAKMIERARILNLHHSKEDILQAGYEREQALVLRHQDEIRQLEALCDLKQEKIRRLEEKTRGLEEDKRDLSCTQDEREAAFLQQLEDKEAVIQRLHELHRRPTDLSTVPVWVGQWFCDKLILHQRAARELTSVAPDSVNLTLLCDALEYLAIEYRDALLGLINSSECLQRCSQKYNRGFSVTPIKGGSVDMYPADYKIKYQMDEKDRPVDRTLDLHLRVGDKSEHLLRIYFFYDKQKKRIVIGSLPRHLRTMTYE